jgi:hypothetical protein
MGDSLVINGGRLRNYHFPRPVAIKALQACTVLEPGLEGNV